MAARRAHCRHVVFCKIADDEGENADAQGGYHADRKMENGERIAGVCTVKPARTFGGEAENLRQIVKNRGIAGIKQKELFCRFG